MKTCFLVLLTAINFVCLNAYAQWNNPNRYKAEVFAQSQIVNLNNVVYSIVPDVLNQQIPQNLNIFFPNKAYDGVAKRPLIMIVHGGAFASNERPKEDYTPYAISFAKMGYVVACIDYRLYNQPQYDVVNNLYKKNGGVSNLPWYVAVQDLNAAIKFICGNAASYADPDNVFLFGESAGAVTTLTLALADQTDINTEITFPAAIGDLNYSTLPRLKSLTYKIKGVAPVAGILPFPSFLDKTDQVPMLMEMNIYDPVIHNPNYASALHFPEIMNQLKTWNGQQSGSYPCSYLYGTWDGTYDIAITSAPYGYHCLNTTGLNYFMPVAADFFAGIIKNNPICIHDNLSGTSIYKLYSSLDPTATPLLRTSTIDDIETPQLSVYPNPVTDYVKIDGLTEQSSVDIFVYDGRGSLINTYTIKTEIGERSTSVSMVGFTSGMYYVHIKDSINDKTFKVIKQ